MRALSGPVNPDGVADPIISHPAVRHMLLFQKAIAEGGCVVVQYVVVLLMLSAGVVR